MIKNRWFSNRKEIRLMTWKMEISDHHPKWNKSRKKNSQSHKSLKSKSTTNIKRAWQTRLKKWTEDKRSWWIVSLDSRFSGLYRKHRPWAIAKKNKSKGIPKSLSFQVVMKETTKARPDSQAKKPRADMKETQAAATALSNR